jgi:outer membrane protein assembly factor BamB
MPTTSPKDKEFAQKVRGMIGPVVAGDVVAVPVGAVAVGLDASTGKELWRVREAAIALANGCAYLKGGTKVFCVKWDDGEVIGTQKNQGGRNPVLEYADGRLFIWPENHHGRQDFGMLGADPRRLPLLTEAWHPPHPHTSAYAKIGIGMPVVDGHIFIRGHDAIYCYDMRKRPIE